MPTTIIVGVICHIKIHTSETFWLSHWHSFSAGRELPPQPFGGMNLRSDNLGAVVLKTIHFVRSRPAGDAPREKSFLFE
jgi:hypothetical protein